MFDHSTDEGPPDASLSRAQQTGRHSADRDRLSGECAFVCLFVSLAKDHSISISLQTFCPNLLLLDLSNVTTVANSHGVLHLEKLQSGCQKLKVLRITNSHITLGPATLEEQV